MASNDHSATYITFDVPGTGNATPTSINPSGAITGYYCDAVSCYGFLRSPDGTFSTFGDPSAVNGTFPASISAPEAITGYYYDANIAGHGFLRAPDGTFTTFDAPGAGTGFAEGTGFSGAGINPAGAVAGAYTDASDVQHGFLRASDGTFTTFDAPGAGTGTFEGTYVVGINPAGAITGQYYDVNFLAHGYLRDRDGALTTFDVPGAIDPYRGTNPSAINQAGAITGEYFQPISGNPFGGNHRGFLRAPDGTFTTFDAATYPPCCIWTFATAITPNETIVGYDNDGHDIFHGFLRTRDGTITLFDAPGAGTGHNQGTIPLAINPAGTITGYYTTDASRVRHGFLRTPH
jgi:hypothetical protein